MKKTSMGIVLLILTVFIFWGSDGILSSNYALMIKIVCIIGACIDVYILANICQRTSDDNNTSKQKQMELLVSGQQKTNELFCGFEQNFKELIDNLMTENKNQNEEQKKWIDECIRIFKDELNNLVSRNEEKLDSVITRLMESEKEKTEKVSELLKEMSDKNNQVLEQTLEGMDKLFRSDREGRDAYYTKLDKQLSESVQGIKDTQNTNREMTITALEDSKEKLDSVITRLMESEKEKTEKVSELLKEMSDKNNQVLEQTLEGMDKLFRSDREGRDAYYTKLDKQLSESVQGIKDTQNTNREMTITALRDNKELNGSYIDEMKKMIMIHEELVSTEKEIRTMNEGLFVDVNHAIERFVLVSESVKDEVSALKMYTKVFEEKMDKRIKEHYEDMREGMEDGNEELQEILNKSEKNQRDALTNQTESLVKCVKHIEIIINESIKEMTNKNDHLISSFERIQDEWASLNKNEIEFLNRIWEEK